MRTFLTSANISVLLCALGIPLAAALAQDIYTFTRYAGVQPDWYIHNTSGTILVLFFAVFAVGAAGLTFGIIGLRKKDQGKRAIVGVAGNTLVLLFTFLWILYLANK